MKNSNWEVIEQGNKYMFGLKGTRKGKYALFSVGLWDTQEDASQAMEYTAKRAHLAEGDKIEEGIYDVVIPGYYGNLARTSSPSSKAFVDKIIQYVKENKWN